jgi:hypothetical protein
MRIKTWATTLGAGLIALASFGATAAGVSGNVVKIGVLTDMSGVYAKGNGKGSVTAAQMAIDDMFTQDGHIRVDGLRVHDTWSGSSSRRIRAAPGTYTTSCAPSRATKPSSRWPRALVHWPSRTDTRVGSMRSRKKVNSARAASTLGVNPLCHSTGRSPVEY